MARRCSRSGTTAGDDVPQLFAGDSSPGRQLLGRLAHQGFTGWTPTRGGRSLTWGLPPYPERRIASYCLTADATAASLTTATSSSVSVLSGALNRSVYASDLRPSPTCSPV